MLQLMKPQIRQMLGGISHVAAQKAPLRQYLFNQLVKRTDEITRLFEIEEMRFLAHAFQRLPTSNAQILQDLWVTYETQDARSGYFVEFGATNGRTNSNTLLLEKSYGWSGILAEPNSVWHADLARNRICTIEHRCVSTNTGQTLEFVAAEDPELSTLASVAENDHFADVRRTAPRISVETVSLNDLLRDHHAPRAIDFMSVDTEGSEYEILAAFDFDKYDVRLFAIEHNNTPNEALIQALMESHGYRRKFPEFSQWDAWYVRA
jgi:FkbM family methyltransferase